MKLSKLIFLALIFSLVALSTSIDASETQGLSKSYIEFQKKIENGQINLAFHEIIHPSHLKFLKARPTKFTKPQEEILKALSHDIIKGRYYFFLEAYKTLHNPQKPTNEEKYNEHLTYIGLYCLALDHRNAYYTQTELSFMIKDLFQQDFAIPFASKFIEDNGKIKFMKILSSLKFLLIDDLKPIYKQLEEKFEGFEKAPPIINPTAEIDNIVKDLKLQPQKTEIGFYVVATKEDENGNKFFEKTDNKCSFKTETQQITSDIIPALEEKTLNSWIDKLEAYVKDLTTQLTAIETALKNSKLEKDKNIPAGLDEEKQNQKTNEKKFLQDRFKVLSRIKTSLIALSSSANNILLKVKSLKDILNAVTKIHHLTKALIDQQDNYSKCFQEYDSALAKCTAAILSYEEASKTKSNQTIKKETCLNTVKNNQEDILKIQKTLLAQSQGLQRLIDIYNSGTVIQEDPSANTPSDDEKENNQEVDLKKKLMKQRRKSFGSSYSLNPTSEQESESEEELPFDSD